MLPPAPSVPALLKADPVARRSPWPTRRVADLVCVGDVGGREGCLGVEGAQLADERLAIGGAAATEQQAGAAAGELAGGGGTDSAGGAGDERDAPREVTRGGGGAHGAALVGTAGWEISSNVRSSL